MLLTPSQVAGLHEVREPASIGKDQDDVAPEDSGTLDVSILQDQEWDGEEVDQAVTYDQVGLR